MSRNYVVEEMTFVEDNPVYVQRPVERPITEEDEQRIAVGEYILAEVTDTPNVSVLCKVMDITADSVLLRRLAQ